MTTLFEFIEAVRRMNRIARMGASDEIVVRVASKIWLDFERRKTYTPIAWR